MVTGIPTISIEELARTEHHHSRGDFAEILGAIFKAEGVRWARRLGAVQV
jgi:hypothetical protein